MTKPLFDIGTDSWKVNSVFLYMMNDSSLYPPQAITLDEVTKYVKAAGGTFEDTDDPYDNPYKMSESELLELVDMWHYQNDIVVVDNSGYTPVQNIGLMKANGERLELPSAYHFDNYAQIKAILGKAGGKYVKNGFTFKGKDAKEIQDRITGGEVINDKKKFQAFFTPFELATEVRDAAEIKSHHSVLEPSAGQGGLVDVLGTPRENVDCIEIQPDNVKVLKEKGYNVIGDNFLDMTPVEQYDRIIMNPPFTKNADITHVAHAWLFLKPGGILSAITSQSWYNGSQKRQQEFRVWLEDLGAVIVVHEPGKFKASGTNISVISFSVRKPENTKDEEELTGGLLC